MPYVFHVLHLSLQGKMFNTNEWSMPWSNRTLLVNSRRIVRLSSPLVLDTATQIFISTVCQRKALPRSISFLNWKLNSSEMSGGYGEDGEKPWSLMHCTEPNCLKAMCKIHRPVQKTKQQQKTLGWHQQGFKVRILEGQTGANPKTNESGGHASILRPSRFFGGIKILPILQETQQRDGPEDGVQAVTSVENSPERFDLMDGAEDDEIERAREASDSETEESLDDKLVIDLDTLNPEDQKMGEETIETVKDLDNVVEKPPLSPFSDCSTISSLSFSTDDEISQALKCEADMNQDGGERQEKINVEEGNEYNNGVDLKDVKLVLEPDERSELQYNPNADQNETEPMDIDENPVIVEVIDVFPVRKSQRLLQKLKINDEAEVDAKAKRSRWITRHCKDCEKVATR